MDGTLSPDKNYVVHGGKWVPAQLSPSHTHYAYDGQWHLLKSRQASTLLFDNLGDYARRFK